MTTSLPFRSSPRAKRESAPATAEPLLTLGVRDRGSGGPTVVSAAEDATRAQAMHVRRRR